MRISELIDSFFECVTVGEMILMVAFITLAIMYYLERGDTSKVLQTRLCELETLHTFVSIKPEASVVEYGDAIKRVCWGGKELEEVRGKKK